MKSRSHSRILLGMAVQIYLGFLLVLDVASAQPTSSIGQTEQVRAIQGLLRETPHSVVENPNDPSFDKRAEVLYRLLGDREVELAQPDAELPLTGSEREQLLIDLRRDPDRLFRVGVLVPRRPEVLEWAALQYKAPEYIPDWLVTNLPKFRPELERRAKTGNETCLWALLSSDFEEAEPILRALLRGEEFLTALSVMRRHPRTELEARQELMRLYRDETASDFTRSYAVELLLGYDWPGRDEFFDTDVLENPLWVQESLDPIGDFVRRNPDVLSSLSGHLGEPSSVSHDNAVLGIVALAQGRPTRENVLPLLPWLLNEKWTNVESYKRSYLFEGLKEADVPEAVPVLLSLLETSEDPAELLGVALALEKYMPAEFEAAWKSAKPRFHHSGEILGYQSELVEIGIRQGWVSMDEQIDAVKFHICKTGRPSDWNGDSEGRYPFVRLLASSRVYEEVPDDEFVRRLLEVAESWREEKNSELPDLEELIFRYPNDAVQTYLVSRLERGEFRLEHLVELAARRRSLTETNLQNLESLIPDGGSKAGVARVLAGEFKATNDVLDDKSQSISLLAMARYVGQELTVDWLRSAASHPELKEAVVAYLQVSERTDGRSLLREISDGYPITGRRSLEANLDEIEKSLVRRYESEGGQGHLYALLTSRDAHRLFRASTELTVVKDQADLTFESRYTSFYGKNDKNKSYDRRTLTAEELESFNRFIQDRRVDEWGEWINPTSHHFTSVQYLHLSPEGGHRIPVIINLGTEQGEGQKYVELIELFETLMDRPAETVYGFMTDVQGAEVIDDRGAADLILADEEGLKVRLQDEEGDFSWWMLDRTGVGARSNLPIPLPNENYYEGQSFFVLPGEVKLVVERERLSKVVPGGRRELFLKGQFDSMELSSDRQTGILVETESEAIDEEGSRVLKLLNLESAQLTRVDLGINDLLGPVAYLPGSGQFLVLVGEYDELLTGPGNGYLVEPRTGSSRAVRGDFRPWISAGRRGLQPAGAARYWAAIQTEVGTEVGLIGEDSFEFDVKAHYPGLFFDSPQMWVRDDEVYVTIGDIIRLPLQGRPL